MKVCLTGATGFIGQNLLESLKNRDDLEVIALSRRITPEMDNSKKGNVTWRRCNGFSMIDVEKAIEGSDILIYLIHSMLPSTSLSQGSFADFDVYLADNFARAARKVGVKKIIYLGGIIPPSKNLSPHLESRKEVEDVLSQYGNNLTALRAGLIVGKNGSSFKILERLINRLPILLCPSWTKNKTQPIDIQDVLASITYCIDHYQEPAATYDIGGPDQMSYRTMLEKTAEVMGKSRFFLGIPVLSPGLSKLWVSKVTSTSSNLVYPLVESLKHEMIVDEKKQLLIPDHEYTRFELSLKKNLLQKAGSWVRTIINYNATINLRLLENVTSLQRIEVMNFTAEETAKEYFRWLPAVLKPLIYLRLDGDVVYFTFISWFNLLILKKSHERSNRDRVVYYIIGGLLARTTTMNGRLEFRSIEAINGILVNLLDFRPSLPWFIYKYSQALFHLLVMKRFRAHMKKMSHETTS